MKNNLFNLLTSFSALALAFGIFQFLDSKGVFLMLTGNWMLLPVLIIFLTLKLLSKRYLKVEKRSHVVILFVSLFIGFTSASFFGHSAFELRSKQSGGIKIE